MDSMRSFIRGIRTRFNATQDSSASLDKTTSKLTPALPVLPADRLHVLTPSASRNDLVRISEASSAFFRLPLELRYQIYIFAFGERIVHMDLRRNRSRRPGQPHTLLDSEYFMGPESPSWGTWTWWSSVCHRNPVLEAWADRCRTGSADTTCFLYPGESPGNCHLGVMGWLLTCRQAYVEGLDVLYHTNTIHIDSLFLTYHLSELILPQRLTSITALEFVWELPVFFGLGSAEWEPNGLNYTTLVSAVASACSSLTKLYIAIKCGSYLSDPTSQRVIDYERKLLGPVDDLVRGMGPKLQECQIAPPLSLYMALMNRAKLTNAHTESGGIGALVWRRFWRPVAREDHQHQRDLGYWVRQGFDDTPLYTMY